MDSSTVLRPNTNAKQRKNSPLERRPRMLKDFLAEDLHSCSSSGFGSFRRRPCQDPSIRNLIEIDLGASRSSKPGHAAETQQRSRTKAASTTISAIQAMINAVKIIHFAAVKSPSILPRSLSRKLSRKSSRQSAAGESETTANEVKATVTIKDIIRWKSFQDLAEEKSPPLDSATTTTTTTRSTSSLCSSNASSWCDSDFTSEYLPLWTGNSDGGVESGEKYLQCVGKESMGTTTTTEVAADSAVGPKGELSLCEEKEQQSPVSVLDFQFGEEDDEEEDDKKQFSSFSQSLATMERKRQKLMQKIRRFECLARFDPVNLEQWMSMETSRSAGEEGDDSTNDDIEEEEEEAKARQLLNRVKATCSLGSHKYNFDRLLLDLFKEELSGKRNIQNGSDEDELDGGETGRLAKAWIDGELDGCSRTEWDNYRKICVGDMERGRGWRKFEEEKEELALEVERAVTSHLVEELLYDLLLVC